MWFGGLGFFTFTFAADKGGRGEAVSLGLGADGVSWVSGTARLRAAMGVLGSQEGNPTGEPHRPPGRPHGSDLLAKGSVSTGSPAGASLAGVLPE